MKPLLLRASALTLGLSFIGIPISSAEACEPAASLNQLDGAIPTLAGTDETVSLLDQETECDPVSSFEAIDIEVVPIDFDLPPVEF